MSRQPVDVVLRQIQQLVAPSAVATLSDRQLLQRFAQEGDETAFAVLVQRHGPLVQGVCRRVLRHTQDSEDTFQAAFLVLARKAGSSGWSESVGHWLYAVAYQLALNARRAAQRRRLAEQSAPKQPPKHPPQNDLGELCAVVDEEVLRLPDCYRIPVLLCYLEAQTRAQAARQLGWSLRTLERRLEQGRELLRQRLTARGVTLTAALLSVELARTGANAAVSTGLLEATVQAARAFVEGKVASGGPLAACLAEGVLRTMFLAKIKMAAAIMVSVCLLAAGVGLLAQTVGGPPDAPPAAGPLPIEMFLSQGVAEPPAAPKVRTDALGDALPPGVLQRLGTMRLRHVGEIGALHFGPDSKTLTSSGGSSKTWLWDVTTGKPIRSFLHAVSSASFSPDGKTMAAGQGNVVRLWDVVTGKEIGQLAGHTKGVTSVCFSGDGKALASCDGVDCIRLWDVATGKEMRRFDGYSFDEEFGPGGPNRARGWIGRMTYAPDGQTLISEGGFAKTTLWDAATGKKIRELESAWCYSPDGKIVASGNGKITLWEAATGKEIHLLPVSAGIHSVCFAPDGKTLASVGGGGIGTNQLWDVTSGKLIRQWQTSSYCRHVRFSPDGATLAATSNSGNIHLFESATGKELRTLTGQVNWNRPPCFAPDGKTLAASYGDLIRLWDVATGQEMHRFPGHIKSVVAVRYAPDGKTLATAGSDNRVRLWDATCGQEIYQVAAAIQWGYQTPEFAQGGKTLCVAGGYHEIQLLDTATGKERRHFQGHPVPANLRNHDVYQSLSCAPDGKTLATTGFDRVIRLWDVADGKEIRQFSSPGMCGPVHVSFAPDGKTLASLHANEERESGICRLWDVASGKEIRRLEVGFHDNFLCYAPDGRTLATTNVVDTIRLWDVASGQPIRQLKRHGTGYIRSLCYAPDGKTLAACWDRTIGLWEVASGKEIQRFAPPPSQQWMNHVGGAWSVAFAPDGRTLAAGYDNGIVLLWDVTGQRPDGHWRQQQLTPQQQRALWEDLASADAATARRAVWTLVAAAPQTVTLLRERLRPADPVATERLKQLVADLDNDQFAVREKATQELEQLADLAEPALHRALEGKPTLEMRRRVERLLEKLPTWAMSGERLRLWRVIQVLEGIGTPEAQQVLQTLASGAPASQLTQEARASLERLAKRAGRTESRGSTSDRPR